MQFAALIVAATLSQAAPAQVSLAMPGLGGLGLSEEEKTFYSAHLAHQMGLAGVRVITPEDIAQIVGLERQKQLLGCSDDNSTCLAEIGNALGVDGVVTGSIARLPDAVQVDVRVISPANAALLAAYTMRAPEAQLPRRLDQAAHDLAVAMKARLRPTEDNTAQLRKLTERVPGPNLRAWSWAPAAGGVAAAGVGTWLLLSASAHLDALSPAAPITLEEAQRHRDTGKLEQTLGAAGVSVGAALLATGAWMYLFGEPEPVPVLVIGGSAGGVGVGISGVLP